MEGIPRKSSPYDTKLRREVALLLHLREISVREVMELYELDEPYYKRLHLWKTRAGARYEKQDSASQEKLRSDALQRFYGRSHAAIKVAAPKGQKSDSEPSGAILDDALISAFIKAESEQPEEPTSVVVSTTEVVETTTHEAKHNLPISHDIQPTPLVENPMSPEAYDQNMHNLKTGGLESCKEVLNNIQFDSTGVLVTEAEIFSNIINNLATTEFSELKIRDKKTYMELFEKALVLRRKAFILPYGHIDPNAKPVISNQKHLHFHNHGLQSFNPNED